MRADVVPGNGKIGRKTEAVLQPRDALGKGLSPADEADPRSEPVQQRGGAEKMRQPLARVLDRVQRGNRLGIARGEPEAQRGLSKDAKARASASLHGIS